ncbi:Cna B-type domain-containing protein [Peptostreptococcus anaerobius]|uniref:Cna B-type domain-containing protein n=1 Tax=Peptostreptococcus porci TaxID=2652282 RepID=A0A6N7XF56_9FIRM|nr:Cna B-type domain-containing protein [Peptostreptococcus porci]MST61994.1 Cna B-type domain-containing protein [Peptostreptococcus porci]
MKKIIILFSSLIVSFSLLFFYSNYKLNAMDSAVTNEQELINAINGNNNVVLSNDITISGAITIPSSYTGTIKSDGTTRTLKLSANFSEENMFVVKTGAKPMFENLTFDGTERGRILDVESNSEVTIANSKLSNASTEQFLKKLENNVNKQRYQGGAIYLSHSTLNLDNVIFDSNHTKLETPKPEKEGDPGIAGHGGAIYSATSVINVKGGSFINNYTGVTVGGKGTNGEGGAIKLDGGSELNINIDSDTRTTFDGNHVYKSEANVGGLQGGAIEITHSTAKINNTDFIVKGGFDTGGAIKFEGAGTKENHNKITNSTFKLVGGQLPQTPEESTYFGTSGGAIMTENSFLTVEKSTFDTDTSKGVPAVAFAGGFIDVVGSGEFNLFDSALRGNGQLWNKPQLSTAKYGGAIAFENGASAKAHIKDTKFNEFTVDHTGGVISVGHRKGASEELGETTVDLTLENSTLDGARAYTYGANSAGAGLYISKGSNVVIKRGTISNMLANYGGAVYNMGSLTLDDNANLSGNFATQMAGGIYNDGYLNIHSANLNNNQKTNDATFSGGNHQYSPGEHSGGTIYAKQNVIIGTDASFSTVAKHDVRVIDGQSSVILSGPRNSQVNVSISETESTAGTGAYSKGFGEDAHRHVGYLVGKELISKDLKASYIPDEMAQSYEPNLEDAKNFHYVSNTVEPEKIAAFNDHEGTGLWDYVYNPENKTVVLGQRAKLVYHTNHESATIQNGIVDNAPAGQKLEQIYTFYESGDSAPKVSINNEPAVDLTVISEVPQLTIGDKDYKFLNWYNSDLNGKPLYNLVDNTPTDDKKYDFNNSTFTKTWHENSTEEIKDILNYESRNTLDTFAVYKEETIKVEGKKTWDDAEDNDGKRPESITIILKADGVEKDRKTVTSDNWSWIFDNLEKSKNGKDIVYTIDEVDVLNYTKEINGFNVINKYTPETINIPVKKIWDDAGNKDSKRPNKIIFKLKNGSEIVKSKELTNQNVSGDDANTWIATFEDVPKYKNKKAITYTVEEVELPDGYISSKNVESISSDSEEAVREGFVVTNKYTSSEPVVEKTSVSVRKVWEHGDNPEANRPTEAKVQLQKEVNGERVDVGDPVVLSNANLQYTFSELPIKDENGLEINYFVKEIDVTKEYKSEITGDKANGYVITNTYNPTNPTEPTDPVTPDNPPVVEKTSVSVQKIWEHGENPIDKRPTKIKVTLLANDVEKETKTIGADEEGNWKISFENLDKYDSEKSEINYTVKEIDVPKEYKSEITGDKANGYVITNTYNSTKPVTPENPSDEKEKISISVVKQWEDRGNETKRPNNIEIKLFSNNVEKSTIIISPDASGNWKHTFNDLEKNGESGNPIEYTIKEIKVPNGYTSVVTGDQSKGFVITNKYTNNTQGNSEKPNDDNPSSGTPSTSTNITPGTIGTVPPKKENQNPNDPKQKEENQEKSNSDNSKNQKESNDESAKEQVLTEDNISKNSKLPQTGDSNIEQNIAISLLVLSGALVFADRKRSKN